MKTTVLPVLWGGLYALAFLPMGFSACLLVALIGFLHCLRGLGPVEARRAGFCFGMALMTTGCCWLHNIFGNLFLVLTALHALFYGLFGWCHAIIDRQTWGRYTKCLAIACAGTGVEYIRAEHFWLDFPWMTPGHGLGVIPFLTQPLLATIGGYGVGFVLVLLCELGMTKRWKWRQRWAVAALLLPMIPAMDLPMIGAFHLWDAVKPDNTYLRTVNFAAIQSESGSLGHFYEATDALPVKPDLVVWPEEALPYDIVKSHKDWELLNELVKKKGFVLVTGTQQGGDKGGWRNTALTLDETGILGSHFKIHTVHLFDDGIPGTEAKPVVTKLGKIGTPICFDCDSEDVVRRMTAAGAEFFAVPSMDPINWGPIQRVQHSALFRIRAAENGRAMVVCATSGVTQIIDGWGQNYQPRAPNGHLPPTMLEPMKPGVLTGVIPIRTGLTIYTRFGWLFPWFALCGGIAFIGTALWRERGA